MTKTTKSDVSSVAFEKALDGVGRAEIESRYRRAVFEVGEMSETLRICQKRGTELHEENVELKDCLRIAKILLENGNVDRALECVLFALSPPTDEVSLHENDR